MRSMTLFTGICLVCLSASQVCPAATVTIDEQTEHQTIEGMGSAAATWLLSSHNDAAFMNMIVNDLGLSMLRLYPDESFESTNENGDPFTTNLGAFNHSSGSSGEQFSVMRHAVNAGLERIIFSVFSPPAWMKYNNSLVGDNCNATDPSCQNRLRYDHYDEFAEYYSAFVRTVRQQVGNVAYAISPENEPAWGQWYSSCVYNYEEMRDITAKLGQRFDQDGLSDVRIFGAEDVITNNWGPYFGYTMNDPVASQYLDALAVHAYENDGATAGSVSATRWTRVGDAAISRNVALWQTETSGYDNNWDDAFTYATGIYTALKFGKAAAWIYLNCSTFGGQQENRALCVDRQPQLIYYASKNYYRWIRPDAVMIDALSDDNEVLSLAFNHKQNKTLTIVLLNSTAAGATKNVTLVGSDLPQFTAYRSTAGERCVEVPGLVSGNTLSLPPASITTLYGTGYDKGVAVMLVAAGRAAVGRAAARVRIHSLDGRLIRSVDLPARGVRSATRARGTYCRTLLDRQGRTLGAETVFEPY